MYSFANETVALELPIDRTVKFVEMQEAFISLYPSFAYVTRVINV